MFRKILALMLSLIILLSLVSCLIETNQNDTTDNGDTIYQGTTNNDTTDNNETTYDDNDNETTTNIEVIPSNSTLSLILSGNAQCTIVYPENEKNDSSTYKAAYNILEAINNIANETKATTTTDFIKYGQSYDSESIEILVGLTRYGETEAVMSTIGYGEYIVKVEGNKIIVSGWVEGAILQAADKFISKIKEISNDKDTLDYQRSNVLTGVYDITINQIPLCEGGKLVSTYDCGNSATMVVLKDCSVAEFNKYNDKLSTIGFDFYVKNIMENNIYSSFTTNKYLLNILYTDYDKNIRIIIEPLLLTSLTGKESENTFTKVIDSTITMAGLDYGAATKSDGSISYQNGVCLIIRLEDKSFIVYDGGFNRAYDATQIYNLMKEQSGTTKPTVAAWIFSHAHSDHMGAFMNFAKTYSSLVNIERFILNRPATGVGSASAEGYSWATIKDALNKFPSAKITKAHTGQVFHIRNSKIEILYTLELFAPKDLTYFNTSTIVCSVEISGFKMMLLGDLSEDGSSISSKVFGSYLKSDLTTVSHHGYSGGTTQLYSLIKPTYVLWPMGAIHYEKYKNQERSSYFFAPNTTVKKIFVARGDVYILPLPYKGIGEIKK